MNLDYKIFKLINQFAGENLIFDNFVILITNYGIIFLALVLTWLWFSKKNTRCQKRKEVLLALIIGLIAICITELIGSIYFRPRPFVTHDVNLLISKLSTDTSFPSTHSTGSFALAFSILKTNKSLGVVLLVFSVLMALSRVFVGVHYPSDVLAGAIISYAVTCFVMFVVIFYTKNIKNSN